MTAAPAASIPAAPVTGRYRRRRDRARMLWLGLAMLLATMLALVFGVYQRERTLAWDNFNVREQELARLTTQALDGRLSAVAVAARVLALSPALHNSGADLGAWERQARRTTEALGGWVVLCAMEPTPVRLFDTLHQPGLAPPPFDAAAAAIIVQTHAAALASDRAVVSDQFTSPISGVPVVMVSVATAPPPAGGPRMTVDYVIDTASLAALLTPQHLGAHAQTTLRDGHDNIIGTTRPHPQDPAHHAARWQDPAHQQPAGLFQDVAATGLRTLYAYQHLDMAPRWRVVVAVPLVARTMLVGGPLWAPLLMAAVLPALMLLSLSVLARRRRAGRDALALIHRVLDEVPAAIFVDQVQPDGRRTRRFVSQSARQVRDGQWTDLPDDPALLAQLLSPANAERFAAFRAEVLARGRGIIEFTIPAAHGRGHDFRTAEACFDRLRDGSVLVVGCVTDITAANAQRERLQQAEKLAVLGEVATGIAHEMNQPLAAIAMAAENGVRALARQPANLARGGAKFSLIQAQVARITAVVSHISLFGRSGFAAAAPFEVAEVIANALRLAAPRLAEQAISLRQELETPLPRLFGVDIMLEQVLLNILINAADAYQHQPGTPPTPDNARLLMVRARQLRPHGPQAPARLLISIADQAGGIAPAAMGRLFDPFFTTRSPASNAGLGLSISFATITEMGGQLRVHNHSGGATFEIELPIPDLPAQAPAEPAAQRVPA